MALLGSPNHKSPPPEMAWSLFKQGFRVFPLFLQYHPPGEV